MKVGDCVTVTSVTFKGYYALVTGNSYGGEAEIQYFEKQSKWWILRDNDPNSMNHVI